MTGVVRRVRRFYPTVGDQFIRWADLDQRALAGMALKSPVGKSWLWTGTPAA
jgi:hypothetical protein